MRRLFSLSRLEALWVAGCLLVLALLSADVVSGGLLEHLDHVMRDRIQPRPPTSPWWMLLPGNVGELGIGAGFVTAASLVTAQVTWRVWPLLLGLGNLLAVEVAVFVLKTVVGRPGPGIHAGRTGYPGYFPSGHTATSAVCVGTAAFLLCTWFSARRLDIASSVGQAVAVVVGAISAARAVLEDNHWVSDGIGGLLLATVVLTVGFSAARRYVPSSARSDRLEAV
jgi:membrane-associated phospholipid phosphatase